MSNARSPRDVCSTTIGTRGLMDLDSIEGRGPIVSGRICRAPIGACSRKMPPSYGGQKSDCISPLREHSPGDDRTSLKRVLVLQQPPNPERLPELCVDGAGTPPRECPRSAKCNPISCLP